MHSGLRCALAAAGPSMWGRFSKTDRTITISSRSHGHPRTDSSWLQEPIGFAVPAMLLMLVRHIASSALNRFACCSLIRRCPLRVVGARLRTVAHASCRQPRSRSCKLACSIGGTPRSQNTKRPPPRDCVSKRSWIGSRRAWTSRCEPQKRPRSLACRREGFCTGSRWCTDCHSAPMCDGSGFREPYTASLKART